MLNLLTITQHLIKISLLFFILDPKSEGIDILVRLP